MKPFLKNLWDGELVLKTFGIDTYVYPHDNVINAYDVSEARLKIELFDKYLDEIPGASEMIKVLRSDLDQIVNKIKTESGHDLSDLNSNVMEYLSATKMGLLQFNQEYSVDYLCWPEKESRNLTPCFKEYPLYRFYEEHHRNIENGVHIFLQLIPSVKEHIQSAEIKERFFWDTTDVEFLNQYNDAVSHLNDPRYTPSKETFELTGTFLQDQGYRFLGYKDLPDWYNLFEDTVKKTPAYRFVGDEFYVTIYFSPRGPIFESVNIETGAKKYQRIAVLKDVLNFGSYVSGNSLPF